MVTMMENLYRSWYLIVRRKCTVGLRNCSFMCNISFLAWKLGPRSPEVPHLLSRASNTEGRFRATRLSSGVPNNLGPEVPHVCTRCTICQSQEEGLKSHMNGPCRFSGFLLLVQWDQKRENKTIPLFVVSPDTWEQGWGVSPCLWLPALLTHSFLASTVGQCNRTPSPCCLGASMCSQWEGWLRGHGSKFSCSCLFSSEAVQSQECDCRHFSGVGPAWACSEQQPSWSGYCACT